MELQFNPILPISTCDDIRIIIDTFFKKVPLSIFDKSDIQIHFNHFYIPNHAAIFNKISDIGAKGFPIAQSNIIVILELPSGLSIYRLEDVCKDALIN